jgi:hypothetical protein
MLTRHSNWQTDLQRFLESRCFTPFRHGSFDCCLFVCGAIEAMTGVDAGAPLRGQYDSYERGLRVVAKYAGRASVEAFIERLSIEHNMPEVPPLCAQRGDVVLLRHAPDFSLAFIGLDGNVLGASLLRGFERVSLNLAVRAWRV